MTNNITANNFRDLSLKGKIKRIIGEPGKACQEIQFRFLSSLGHLNYKPFLILTRDRTGSNMLVQYLNSHPHIRCEYERLGLLSSGDSGPKLVKKIYAKQPFYIKAKGFKVFYYHPMNVSDDVYTETWNALVSIPNLHLIHLRRINVLEAAVSSKIAYETGVYGNLVSKQANEHSSVAAQGQTAIQYPIEKLQAVFEQTQQWEEEWPKRFSQCPQIEITYEDLCADPGTQLATICNFLGIEKSFKPRTIFRKQRTKSIRASLANYAELKLYFESTPWAKFFSE